MAFILPKGIVVNSPDIEGSIERINAQPLDLEDIAKFWKVYTTTKRRLLDPTAERLENYWWRIWGSRRRELNGATVARLFAYISDGQSFVPLRGPANRDEGTPPLNRTTRHGPGAASATTLHRPSQSRPSTTSSSTASRAPVTMPHPILKKTRGPSSTGPRPTARFISPHESEAESGTTTTNSSNRSSSPNTHITVQPPSPDSQNSKTDKKATVAKKGVRVASTAAKKRPAYVRRQSSQSSAENAAKIEAQDADQAHMDRIPPTLSETHHSKGKAPSRLPENLSPDLLVHAPRKRPSKSPDAKRTSPRKPNRKGSSEERNEERTPEPVARGEPGPSTRLRSFENQQTPSRDMTEEEFNELELQRTLLKEANARMNRASGSSHQTLTDREGLHSPYVLSHTASEAQDQDIGANPLLPDAKSTARVAQTFAAAAGELDLGDTSKSPLPHQGAKGKNKGKGKDSEDIGQTEMFTKRPVPPVSGTAAAPTSDESLARSKSQLTLLLEKDRAISGDHKPRDEKGINKNRRIPES